MLFSLSHHTPEWLQLATQPIGKSKCNNSYSSTLLALVFHSVIEICPQDPSFLLWTRNALPVCMQPSVLYIYGQSEVTRKMLNAAL